MASDGSPLHVLLSMGFPQDRAFSALDRAKNDLERALDMLSADVGGEPLSGPGPDQPFNNHGDDAEVARALQRQMRDEDLAWRAQRELDDESIAIAMQRRMRVADERTPAPTPAMAAPSSARPPPEPGSELTKKQRANRRKREVDKLKRANVREVSRVQERPHAEL